MRNSTRRITVILILILVLPAVFYSVFEITSLSEEEEMIGDIYEKQLDAILFSLNQYSEDVVGNWTGQVNGFVKQEDSIMAEKFNGLLTQFTPISFIFLADKIDNTEFKIFFNPVSGASNDLTGQLKILMNENEDKINRLFVYQESGFYKNEPLKSNAIGNLTSITFLLENPQGVYQICGIVIDPQIFLTEIMAPRMQTIAGEKFIISSFLASSDSLIYSTQSLLDGEDSKIIGQKKSIWLTPNYLFGIALKGTTINDLVEQRTFSNIILIIAVDLILLIGAWFVLRNIKREMQLVQNKSDFVSNVSHEIRTPLSLISMFAETLQMDRVKTEQKKKDYYSIINKEANRLTGLVNSILNFSKMEANQKEYKFGEVNLNKVVSDILNSYDYHLTNNGFTSKCDLTNDLPIIEADHEAISEAIRNLLDNAIKYSKSKKSIELKTGISDGYAYTEVKDEGVGIPKSLQKNIFDKFYRVATGSVHNTKGTGLGLAIVKHIVDSHKGKIILESDEGKGCSVKLFFPIYQNVK